MNILCRLYDRTNDSMPALALSFHPTTHPAPLEDVSVQVCVNTSLTSMIKATLHATTCSALAISGTTYASSPPRPSWNFVIGLLCSPQSSPRPWRSSAGITCFLSRNPLMELQSVSLPCLLTPQLPPAMVVHHRCSSESPPSQLPCRCSWPLYLRLQSRRRRHPRRCCPMVAE